MRRFPTLELLPTEWELRAKVTSHDACYVAMARELGCALVTGDSRGRRTWVSP